MKLNSKVLQARFLRKQGLSVGRRLWGRRRSRRGRRRGRRGCGAAQGRPRDLQGEQREPTPTGSNFPTVPSSGAAGGGRRRRRGSVPRPESEEREIRWSTLEQQRSLRGRRLGVLLGGEGTGGDSPPESDRELLPGALTSTLTSLVAASPGTSDELTSSS